MPVVVTQNTHQGLKLTNGGGYTALEVIVDKAYPGHRVSADTTMHFGPWRRRRPRSTTSASGSGRGSATTSAERPAVRGGLRMYRLQGARQNVRARGPRATGARATNVDGRVVPAQCDPYGLYVQLSRCRTLDASMLVSKVRKRDLVGNRVPEEMSGAQSSGRRTKGVEER
ncbi:PIF1 protein [Hirsutella rhossiliensis]